jgi:phosphoglycolate phosphatase
VLTEDWHRLRQQSIAKGLRYIGVKPYQLAKLLTEGRRLIQARAHDIKLFPGAADLVNQLAKKDHQLYILSTNNQEVVRAVLEDAGVNDKIIVLKSPRLFSKASSLRRLLRQTGTAPGTAWMIGDEVRDITAAKRVGMRSLAVTWGFQPKVILAAQKPNAIATSLSDIPALLEVNL